MSESFPTGARPGPARALPWGADMGIDGEWFDEVFREHAAAVHRYFARRSPADDVEDLTAEVFAVAWRRRADVPADFVLPWLYRTAGFVLANHRRRRQAVPVEEIGERDAGTSTDPADAVVEDDAVRSALATLSDRDRRILLLHAWEGLDGAALAAALGVSRGGAAAALSRARSRLAAAFAEHEPAEQAEA